MRPVIKLSLFLSFLSMVALVGAFAQRSQLHQLQLQCDELRAKRQLQAQEPLAPAQGSTQTEPAGDRGSSELLQLRNQVGQLNRQMRELSQVQQEQVRLQEQLRQAGTNKFIRRSQAKRAGYQTPADTMETFLWSIQNRNVEALLECFTPEAAVAFKQAAANSGRSSEDFFREVQALVGMKITNQKTLPDGSIEIEVEMAPGPGIPSAKLRLENVNGQWKLATPL